MAQIRITPEELRAGAGSLNTLAETIIDNLTELNSIVTGVTDNWEGAAQTAYLDNFNELLGQFKESFPPAIQGLGEQMNATADSLEEADEQIASAFRG